MRFSSHHYFQIPRIDSFIHLGFKRANRPTDSLFLFLSARALRGPIQPSLFRIPFQLNQTRVSLFKGPPILCVVLEWVLGLLQQPASQSVYLSVSRAVVCMLTWRKGRARASYVSRWLCFLAESWGLLLQLQSDKRTDSRGSSSSVGSRTLWGIQSETFYWVLQLP